MIVEWCKNNKIIVVILFALYFAFAWWRIDTRLSAIGDAETKSQYMISVKAHQDGGLKTNYYVKEYSIIEGMVSYHDELRGQDFLVPIDNIHKIETILHE